VTPGLTAAQNVVIDTIQTSGAPDGAHDYAFIILNPDPGRLGSAGDVRIQQAVGGVPLSLDSANHQPWTVYGYPGADLDPTACGGKCDPLLQRYCGGKSLASTTGNGETAQPNCTFQPGMVPPLIGDSGSPWLNSLNAVPGIASVLTRVESPGSHTILGPWLGQADNADQHFITAALLCSPGGSCP
jgi:hypothetical protein